MTIAIIQSDPLVPPGLVTEALTRAGVAFRIIHAHGGQALPLPATLSGAVVLGGTMCALDTENYPFIEGVNAFIAQGLAADLPLLGICLGGQLMARVAGGRVHAGQNGERGLCRIQQTGCDAPLLAGLPSSFLSFQWHDDSFDPPPGAPVLAGTQACPHQAFRAAPRAYGLQFHPEVTPEIAAGWSRLSPGSAHHIDTLARHWPAYRSASLMLLNNFIRRVLPSDGQATANDAWLE